MNERRIIHSQYLDNRQIGADDLLLAGLGKAQGQSHVPERSHQGSFILGYPRGHPHTLLTTHSPGLPTLGLLLHEQE